MYLRRQILQPQIYLRKSNARLEMPRWTPVLFPGSGDTVIEPVVLINPCNAVASLYKRESKTVKDSWWRQDLIY